MYTHFISISVVLLRTSFPRTTILHRLSIKEICDFVTIALVYGLRVLRSGRVACLIVAKDILF